MSSIAYVTKCNAKAFQVHPIELPMTKNSAYIIDEVVSFIFICYNGNWELKILEKHPISILIPSHLLTISILLIIVI